jgi:hypothetical protein
VVSPDHAVAQVEHQLDTDGDLTWRALLLIVFCAAVLVLLPL